MIFRFIWDELMRMVCARRDHVYRDEWRVEVDDRGEFSHRALFRVCDRCDWEHEYPPFGAHELTVRDTLK